MFNNFKKKNRERDTADLVAAPASHHDLNCYRFPTPLSSSILTLLIIQTFFLFSRGPTAAFNSVFFYVFFLGLSPFGSQAQLQSPFPLLFLVVRWLVGARARALQDLVCLENGDRAG